ncbi:MAG: hypothetical protein JSR87_12570 [Proteobacteria bacterium]|nr:hypothetical protein [Pseudomonadota bacterium]MBS0572447.1 hypothetical protein [Pseudomonadota bacterium]
MMLTEQTAVPTAALPLQEFKDHLRLGTGFADDGVQDVLAQGYLRAAITAIEGRIGKALIERDFLLTLPDWRDDACQALPVAPVSAIGSVVLRDAAGAATVVAPGAYRLRRDMHRPKLAGAGGALPPVPTDGSIEILFTAGFGPAWADVPGDLAQAVFLLAAGFHEHRHAVESTATLPYGVLALIERWRTVRVLGGGEA